MVGKGDIGGKAAAADQRRAADFERAPAADECDLRGAASRQPKGVEVTRAVDSDADPPQLRGLFLFECFDLAADPNGNRGQNATRQGGRGHRAAEGDEEVTLLAQLGVGDCRAEQHRGDGEEEKVKRPRDFDPHEPLSSS